MAKTSKGSKPPVGRGVNTGIKESSVTSMPASKGKGGKGKGAGC